MLLRSKLLWHVLPPLLLLQTYQILLSAAYMKSVRIEEIPFELTEAERDGKSRSGGHSGIHATARLEQQRSFFHLFNVPYIVCFFAAKGKWPFIPPMMQVRVDSVAKTVFSQNDSFIRQFCHKWIQIKECFRPVMPTKSQVETLEPARATPCTCANLVASGTVSPMVYFDKDHIGNVSSDVILNTIEFLESFLPPPTKKPKRKHRVRSRLDEIEIT